MSGKKFRFLMAVMLVLAAVLTACTTAAPTAAPTEQITDTELNVLCTPQEQWCQGMKQEFEAKCGKKHNKKAELTRLFAWLDHQSQRLP